MYHIQRQCQTSKMIQFVFGTDLETNTIAFQDMDGRKDLKVPKSSFSFNQIQLETMFGSLWMSINRKNSDNEFSKFLKRSTSCCY